MTLALFLTGTACSSDTAYTYVDVHVTIDPTTVTKTQLYLVTSCELMILGADAGHSYGLPCVEKEVPYDVGTFQYSSKATSGTLQFLVRILDGNHVLVGESTSDPVPVSPGKHLQTSVVVVGVTPPATGGDVDAGADADQNPSADGSTDGLTSGSTDGSVDLFSAEANADVPSTGDAPAEQAAPADLGQEIPPGVGAGPDGSEDAATADAGVDETTPDGFGNDRPATDGGTPD
jgi:hypothetical protein